MLILKIKGITFAHIRKGSLLVLGHLMPQDYQMLLLKMQANNYIDWLKAHKLLKM